MNSEEEYEQHISLSRLYNEAQDEAFKCAEDRVRLIQPEP
jgi:hypothetical protein